MKSLFFSFALALAIPSLAFAEPDLESDCKKGEGKCTTEFYSITGTAIVSLNCTDGSSVHDGGVSSPNSAISCEPEDGDKSHHRYICDRKGKKITYDIKSHLTCK